MSDITIAEALALTQIIEAAQGGRKVVWLNEEGNRMEGVARHICSDAETFGFLGSNQNVFEGFLRVTTSTGFELAQPISQIVPMVGKRWFVSQY